MQTFYIASAVYLAISIGLVAMLHRMGVQRDRLFSSLYGTVVFEDLDEEQAARWAGIHRREFDSGFWRVVAIAYMIWHYPGLISMALLRRGSLHPIPMVIVSAFVWIGILFLVFAPPVS